MLFDWQLARESLVPLLLGTKITVLFTILVMGISLIGAIPVALARLSNYRLIRWAVTIYVNVFRATPLLIQLIYIYYALPVFGIRLSPFMAGLVGLSLHYIPFIAEVYRSGIQAIPQGQRDAAQALGLSRWLINRKVIFPQAFRIVIPSLGNFFVSLVKDTSLLSVLTVTELVFSGELIAARTYDYFTEYTLVFVFYLVLGSLAIWLVQMVERRAPGIGSTKAPGRKLILGLAEAKTTES
jgi:His/Glu/Gln/Arg/opine family amino acid ABC transporter permease subunit